jgi:hypothetical protein
MPLTIFSHPATPLNLPLDRTDAPHSGQVGPGWEILLMPEPLARLTLRSLTGRPGTAATASLGWVFAHAGQWGIFLPEESDDPAWPPDATYLKAGANVTLPPWHWRIPPHHCGSGWVRQYGYPLSRPMMVHPVVTVLSAGPFQ